MLNKASFPDTYLCRKFVWRQVYFKVVQISEYKHFGPHFCFLQYLQKTFLTNVFFVLCFLIFALFLICLTTLFYRHSPILSSRVFPTDGKVKRCMKQLVPLWWATLIRVPQQHFCASKSTLYFINSLNFYQLLYNLMEKW
jgi:hypothetical protein